MLKSLPEDVLGLRLHVQLINYFLSRGEALMLSDLLPCCANLLRLNPPNGSAEQQGEKAAKLAQKLDQLQPFIAVFPQECMGQLALLGQPHTSLAQGVHVEALRARAHAVVEYDLAQRPE